MEVQGPYSSLMQGNASSNTPKNKKIAYSKGNTFDLQEINSKMQRNTASPNPTNIPLFKIDSEGNVEDTQRDDTLKNQMNNPNMVTHDSYGSSEDSYLRVDTENDRDYNMIS